MVAWLVALVVLDPRGAFPLNDDWSYAVAVRRLVEDGAFHPTGWTSMPLLTHVVWGGLFSLGGMTFEALRLSTVVAGAVAGYGVYVLLADLGAPRRVASVVQATFLFCPLTVGLAVTYMTDLPYAALEVWAAVLLLRHLRCGSDWAFWAGTLVAIAGTLSRQTGLAIPLAFGIALLVRRGVSVGTAWRAGVPLVASTAGLLIVQTWLTATGRMPTMYAGKIGATVERAASLAGASQVVGNVHSVLITLGLLLVPVLILVGPEVWRQSRYRAWWAVAAAAVVALGGARLLAGGPGLLPLLGNTLVDSGVGPLTLIDTAVLDVGNVPGLPDALWGVATVLGTGGAVVLLAALGPSAVCIVRNVRAWGDAEAAGACLLLAAAATLAPMLPGDLFDRYLIAVLPLVAAGVVALVGPLRLSRLAFAVAAVAVVGWGTFGVAGTHDYLAWNRARWGLLDWVAQEDPAAWSRIDGGFEFNGLLRYDASEARHPGRSWWSRGDDDVIAFGPVPGYEVMAQVPYRRWLPPGTARVVWLRRSVPSGGQRGSARGSSRGQQRLPP